MKLELSEVNISSEALGRTYKLILFLLERTSKPEFSSHSTKPGSVSVCAQSYPMFPEVRATGYGACGRRGEWLSVPWMLERIFEREKKSYNIWVLLSFYVCSLKVGLIFVSF